MRFLVYALTALLIALWSLAALAQDAPKLRFIPICETLGTDVGTVECIPQSTVDSWERFTLWNYAARQLHRCPIVVLDSDLPATSDNLGYRCNGVLTKEGVIAE